MKKVICIFNDHLNVEKFFWVRQISVKNNSLCTKGGRWIGQDGKFSGSWCWQLRVCQSCPWQNGLQELCAKIQRNTVKLHYSDWTKCRMLLPHWRLQWRKFFANNSTHATPTFTSCRPLSYNLDSGQRSRSMKAFTLVSFNSIFFCEWNKERRRRLKTKIVDLKMKK